MGKRPVLHVDLQGQPRFPAGWFAEAPVRTQRNQRRHADTAQGVVGGLRGLYRENIGSFSKSYTAVYQEF